MYFLDVAVGPMYAMIGLSFLAVAAAMAAVVFGAIWIIKKIIKKNKGE